MDISYMVYPVSLTYPMDVFFDPDTGDLVFECQQMVGDRSHKFRFIMEPKAALQLLYALPAIQREAAHIIEEKAKQAPLH